MTPNFCVHPWISMHYQKENNGNVRGSPCCLIKSTTSCDSIEDYVQSDYLKKIKSTFLQDKIPAVCSRCVNEESAGLVSKRQRDNKTYWPVYKLKFEKNKNPIHFFEYKVRLGNYCNLRCTTCSGLYSSSWITEDIKFEGKSTHIPINDLKEDSIWDNLKAGSKTIGNIEFIGGEPTVISIDKQVDLFEYFINTGDCKHIALYYTTNGTRFPKELSEYFSYFKVVNFAVSIDGVKDQFEYLRYPAKWDTFCSVLDQYCQLREKNKNFTLTLDYTLSIFNLLEVEKIIEFAKFKNIELFYGTGLTNPTEFSLYSTDKRLKDWFASNPTGIKDQQILSMISKYQNSESNNNLQAFLDRCHTLDQRRNTNVAKVFPVLVDKIKSLIQND